MARIVRTLAAERDLDQLFDWIARDSGIDRADAVLTRIDEVLVDIAEMPRIGRVRRDLDGAPRSFAIWPWLVLYESLEDEDGILLLRVVDGRRNLQDL